MHRVAIACLLCCALGCGRDAPIVTAPPAVVADATPAPAADSTASLLAGTATGPWVYPSRSSSLRFGRHGGARVPVLEKMRAQPGPMAIVEETADRVLLRDNGSWYRFLVWASKAELDHVVVQDTAAVPATGAQLQILRGAPVEILERRGDRLRVRLVDGLLDVTAEVDAAHVGDRVDREPPPWRQLPAPLFLANGTALRSAPRTDAPVILRTHGVWTTPVGAAAGGWQEVEVETFRARARGFVPERAITAVPPPLPAPPPAPPPPRVARPDEHVIPYGACVFDRPGGEIIGVHMTEQPTIARSGPDGWAEIHAGAGGLAFAVSVRLDGPGGPELCLSRDGRALR